MARAGWGIECQFVRRFYGVKRAHLVDSDVDVIWHEKLPGVSHLTRDEGAVGQHVPLGVDSSVDVCKHKGLAVLP